LGGEEGGVNKEATAEGVSLPSDLHLVSPLAVHLASTSEGLVILDVSPDFLSDVVREDREPALTERWDDQKFIAQKVGKSFHSYLCNVCCCCFVVVNSKVLPLRLTEGVYSRIEIGSLKRAVKKPR